MPVEIKFIGENGQQAALELANFLGQMTALTNPANAAAVVAAAKQVVTASEPTTLPPEGQVFTQSSPTETKPEPVKEEKPKKEKAKKEPAKAEAPSDEVLPPPSVDDEVPETLEGCQSLVRTVMETDGTKDGSKGGLKLAHTLITSFGVARVRDLPAEKYAAFIAECKKKIKEQEMM